MDILNRQHAGSLAARLAAPVLLASVLLLPGCGQSVPSGNMDSGYSAVESGNYQEAEQSFETALTEGEDTVLSYRGLGLALMGQARYSEAVDAFNQALAATDDKMEQTVIDLLRYRETAQYRGQDYDGVIDTAQTLLGRDESCADAYFYRGAAFLCKGDQDKAKVNFDSALSLTPSDYSLYLNIYRVYNENHLSGVGDEYLQAALSMEPTDDESRCQVGQIYYYLEQYDEAQNAVAQPADSGYEPALSLLGQIYLAREEYDKAKAVYTRIRSLSPDSTDSFNGLALVALAQGDPDTALVEIGSGLALEGEEGKQQLYFNEIVAYEKKLDFAAAKSRCEAYVQKYPTDEQGKKELIFLNSRS